VTLQALPYQSKEVVRMLEYPANYMFIISLLSFICLLFCSFKICFFHFCIHPGRFFRVTVFRFQGSGRFVMIQLDRDMEYGKAYGRMFMIGLQVQPPVRDGP